MLHDQFGEFLRSAEAKGFPRAIRLPFEFMDQEVTQAPRYSLDRAAVAMVQNISMSKPSTFLKAMPILRLPAPSIWVEFAFKDRADWLAEATKRGLINTATTPSSVPPSRLGFLLREVEVQDETVIEINVSWVHEGNNVEVALKQMLVAIKPETTLVTPQYLAELRKYMTTGDQVSRFSPETRRQIQDPAEMEAAIMLEARLKGVPAFYWSAVWDAADPQRRREMDAQGDYDMVSEWRFVLALIACLNSRNLVRFGEDEDFAVLNRKRAKAGKARLKSYKPITLNLSPVQRRRIIHYVRDKGVRAKPSEPQFVIGHLKLRKTGVFWWCPHNRYGEAVRPREYKVTA